MNIETEKMMEAARRLRVAIEDERDSRTGLAAVAADELVREFAALNAKLNRYADAARKEGGKS